MFWFKPFRNFLRKIAIFRNFDHWSELLSMSAGRPLGQGVCPSLPPTSPARVALLFPSWWDVCLTSAIATLSTLCDAAYPMMPKAREMALHRNLRGWLEESDDLCCDGRSMPPSLMNRTACPGLELLAASFRQIQLLLLNVHKIPSWALTRKEGMVKTVVRPLPFLWSYHSQWKLALLLALLSH